MVFSSTVYLFLFFPMVLLIYFNPFVRGRVFRNVVLFVASIGFYAWGEYKFVFAMLFSICFNWALGMLIDQSKGAIRKIWFMVAVCYNLGILFVFKYAAFVSKNINMLFGKCILNVNIILPIGISFFTFQILSYIIDIYRGKVAVQKNVLKLGLYISMFPQLIAGPIVRYELIADEIDHRQENVIDFMQGFQKFVYGLGKKALLANYLAVVADNVFTFSDHMSVLTAWLGMIAYTLQIYFDFSGYSDMAIGLGRIFGFHFDDNFNYPYTAKSVTEFWRRWHISLSSWFRDYVYIPLGGNRCSKKRWVFNMFVVWLLTGIWHGANWTFIAWGLIYFIVLIFEKFSGLPRDKKIVSHIYTILTVMLAWVFFRSETIGMAISYIGVLFGIGAKGFTDMMGLDMLASCRIILPTAVLLATPIYAKALELLKKTKVKAIVENGVLLCLFLLSLLSCMKSSYNPFIYYNF